MTAIRAVRQRLTAKNRYGFQTVQGHRLQFLAFLPLRSILPLFRLRRAISAAGRCPAFPLTLLLGYGGYPPKSADNGNRLAIDCVLCLFGREQAPVSGMLTKFSL